jgi:ketosteroid isomerase-like protein
LSDNAEVVRRHFETLSRRGVEAAASFWHPQIDWRAIPGALDDKGVITGHQAMLAYYRDWAETVDDIETTVDEVFLDAGEQLVVALRVTGHVRGSSVPVSSRYFIACTIRDGLILSGREFATAEEALQAVGTP